MLFLVHLSDVIENADEPFRVIFSFPDCVRVEFRSLNPFGAHCRHRSEAVRGEGGSSARRSPPERRRLGLPLANRRSDERDNPATAEPLAQGHRLSARSGLIRHREGLALADARVVTLPPPTGTSFTVPSVGVDPVDVRAVHRHRLGARSGRLASVVTVPPPTGTSFTVPSLKLTQ